MKFYRREALKASLRSISGYIREAGAMRLGGDYSLHIHFFQGFSFTASCGPFPEVSIHKALPTLSPVLCVYMSVLYARICTGEHAGFAFLSLGIWKRTDLRKAG